MNKFVSYIILSRVFKVVCRTLILCPVVTANALNWTTGVEEAKISDQKENKTIVFVFQGSDWCAPCIKLDREIWSTDEF